MTKKEFFKIAVSVIAGLLIVARILLPDITVDSVTVGLLFIAILPWVMEVIESLEFPGGYKLKFRELEKKQQQQSEDIRRIKFLISHFVSDAEFAHLTKLASAQPFTFVQDDTTSFFFEELRRLRALNLIAGHPNRGIRSLERVGGDVKDHFYITDQGREYLQLRTESDTAEGLSD